ncbi:MAG: transposase [Melioribacteraceae bacterium]|nr:transposase [Melioribacteraceae bacterium]
MVEKKFEECRSLLIDLVSSGYGRYTVAREFGIHPSKARRWIDKIRNEKQPTTNTEDAEVIIKLSKTTQNLMDKNRIERKKTRENYRITNSLEELTEKMIELLNEKSFSINTVTHKEKPDDVVAIIQLSDLHLNELIDNVGGNSFSFEIASSRLKMFAQKIKQYLIPVGVTHVLIAMTGDIINSDRRLDEVLNQATNRTKAMFLAIDILVQFIKDLNENFNISISSVSGNESRVGLEYGSSDAVMSDNYDYAIHNMLKYLFVNSPGISFVTGNCVECLVNMNGQNVLLIHGNGCIQSGATEKSVAQIKGRYASRGVIVNYVIFGHTHSAQIGDQYSRSSSLCGSNAYSEKSLNLAGRASQNIYLFYSNGLRDGIKIDLQVNTEDGYPFDKELISYNSKSDKKTHLQESVFSVVI